MKKIFRLGLIAAMMAAFAFVSCSKDDDGIKSDLIGDWIGTTTEIYYDGELLMSFKDTHTSNEYDLWKFKSNGTAERIDKTTGTITKHEYYSFSLIDNTIEMVNDSSKEKSFYEFDVKGNNLTLTSTSKEKGHTSVLIQNYIRK